MSENNHHLTPADLKGLEERLREREMQLEERLKSYMGEQIERLETKLLTAFHGWARSIEVRVRMDETAAHGVSDAWRFSKNESASLNAGSGKARVWNPIRNSPSSIVTRD